MTEIKNGKIIHSVKLGTDSAIVVRSQDLPEFDEIRMDIKYIDKIQADPVISLSSLEGGNLRNGNNRSMVYKANSFNFRSSDYQGYDPGLLEAVIDSDCDNLGIA